MEKDPTCFPVLMKKGKDGCDKKCKGCDVEGSGAKRSLERPPRMRSADRRSRFLFS